MDLLRKAGADPSTKGLQGVSELYTAAKVGETDIVKSMLESGTDRSVQTSYYWAPLHWAASFGHIECVRLLVVAGADVSVISDQRVTPINLAIQASQDAVAELLSTAGAKKYQDLRPAPFTDPLAQLEQEGEWVPVYITDTPEKGHTTVRALPETVGTASQQTKLRLVYDKPLIRTSKHSTAVGQFVFVASTSGPSENIYEVSHVLEAHTSSISGRHYPTRAEMWDYPLKPGHFNANDILYDIVRMRPDYQEFELRGRLAP